MRQGLQSARVLDPYGAGGWAPQPRSHHGAAGGPTHWCEQRPGRSSDPVTPVGDAFRQVDSPFHATCPVHSPFRFRYINGGPDYYPPHHQVMHAYLASRDLKSRTALAARWHVRGTLIRLERCTKEATVDKILDINRLFLKMAHSLAAPLPPVSRESFSILKIN